MYPCRHSWTIFFTNPLKGQPNNFVVEEVMRRFCFSFITLDVALLTCMMFLEWFAMLCYCKTIFSDINK